MKKQKRWKKVISCFLALLFSLSVCMPDPVSAQEMRPETTFASCRLLITAEDAGIFRKKDKPIASFENLYLLQFQNEAETEEAYSYYCSRAVAVEPDTKVSAADQETSSEAMAEAFMTKEENPLRELKEELKEGTRGSFDLALIDTGCDGADEAVSVIGEDPSDDNGHGTRMGKRIREQDPDAKILSVKALDESGRGDVSAIYAAIRLAMERNVRIINLSLSSQVTEDSKVLEEIILEAISKGILVVGAAGNNGHNTTGFLPAGIGDAFIVGAADPNGESQPFSNVGETLDANIKSESTSDASAIASGWFSRNGTENAEKAFEEGLFIKPWYIDPEKAAAITSAAGRSVFQASDTDALGAMSWEELKPILQGFIGVPYVHAGHTPQTGWDCSGFVGYVIKEYYDTWIGYGQYGTGPWWDDYMGDPNAVNSKAKPGNHYTEYHVAHGKTDPDLSNENGVAKYQKLVNAGTIRPGDIICFYNADMGVNAHMGIVHEGYNVLHAWYSGFGTNLSSMMDICKANGLHGANKVYTDWYVYRGLEIGGSLKVKKVLRQTDPKLIVKKQVKGQGSDSSRTFSFTVKYTKPDASKQTTETIRLKSGESWYAACEPGSAYHVKETAAEGYTAVPAKAEYSGKMSEAKDTKSFSFQIRFGKSDPVKFSLRPNKTKTFEDIDNGTSYKITEDDPGEGWTSSFSTDNASGKIESGKTIVVKCVNKYSNPNTTVTFTNERDQGYLSLLKVSKDPERTGTDPFYSLKGAEYAVYAADAGFTADSVYAMLHPEGKEDKGKLKEENSMSDGRCGTFRTDADGKGFLLSEDGTISDSTRMMLPTGSYFIAETVSPKHFIRDEKVYEARVGKETEVTITSEEEPALKPGLQTTLMRTDGSKMFHPDEKVSLADDVLIEGLDLSGKYELVGTLMDQTTKEPLKDKEGKPVSGTVAFEAEKRDSFQTVEFTIDASKIEHNIVAFEELYQIEESEDGESSRILVAEHKDLTDEDQTITFEPNPDPPKPDPPKNPPKNPPENPPKTDNPGPPEDPTPKTGDTADLSGWLFTLTGAVCVSVFALYLIRRKKKAKCQE